MTAARCRMIWTLRPTPSHVPPRVGASARVAYGPSAEGYRRQVQRHQLREQQAADRAR